MLSANKVVYVCQVSKLQLVYVIALILLFVLKNTKQTRLYQIQIKSFEKKINSSLVGFSTNSYLPPCSTEFHNHNFI